MTRKLIAGILCGAISGALLVEFAMYMLINHRPKIGWQVHYDLGRVEKPFKRLLVAEIGLGALVKEEALYFTTNTDNTKDQLDGEHTYQLTFTKDQLPDVNAFWSVSAYDSDSFYVDNELSRFSLSEPNSEMAYQADGSLIITFSSTPPENTPQSNWLPVPSDKFSVTFRAYKPNQALLKGEWMPPELELIKGSK